MFSGGSEGGAAAGGGGLLVGGEGALIWVAGFGVEAEEGPADTLRIVPSSEICVFKVGGGLL